MAPDDFVCGCHSEDQVSVYKTFGQIPSSLIEAEKGPPSFFTMEIRNKLTLLKAVVPAAPRARLTGVGLKS